MTPNDRHAYFDGKIQLYRRPETRHWQASCTVGGRQMRTSTKEDNLTRAKEAAWDWYLTVQGKYRAGDIQTGMTFKKAAELFLAEYEAITAGERSPIYVAQQEMNVRVHLMPFFGKMTVNEITGGTVQQYRAHRMTSRKDKEGICFRLTEGADIYQIAKNCRTSVEMIEKFYASHIKDMIDASAINMRKPRPKEGH